MVLDRPPPAPGLTVVGDRRCLRCGYALRGLPVDGTCPECGLAVRLPRGQVDAPLSEMPESVIRRLRLGSILTTIVLLTFIVFEIGPAVLPSSAWLRPGAVLVVRLLIALAWWGAVWLVTPALRHPAAIILGFGRTGRLRLAVRLLQVGWVAAAGAALLFDSARTRLAHWARDDAAESALSLALWGMPICTVAGSLNLPIPFIGILIGVGWLISAAALPYGLVRLSGSISYSIVHARERRERESRRCERRREYMESMAERSAGPETRER
jgi:hypothetical protein